LWVVVGIILIGLFLSQGETLIPLTVSISIAGIVVLVFSRGVDRMFGFILIVAGALLTVHEYRQSTPEESQMITKPEQRAAKSLRDKQVTWMKDGKLDSRYPESRTAPAHRRYA
jgi:hypothetical protein